MNAAPLQLLLADDDTDDRIFFKEALEELPVATKLTMVNDGAQLMHLLSKPETAVPDFLFLDLNMPRKNGFECLSEIKCNKKLMEFPVIIYSTSLDHEVVNLLYEKGAHHYIRKPGDFLNLKKVIHKAITKTGTSSGRPPKEKFILQP